jgi:hypothetical protein
MIPAVPRALKLSGLAAVFAAGLVLAVTLPVGGGAADKTTTDTTTTDTTTTDTTTAETTTTTPETTTETTTTTLPGRTVTVETTTTNFVTLPNQTTTTEETSSSNGTEAWVWVLLGILAAGLIALIVLFATRGHGGGGHAIPPEDRLRRLDGAVASWAAQGWAVETQTADSAVLRRGAETMLVSVDPGGHVVTRPLAEPPPQQSGGDWPGAAGDS